MVRSYSVLFDDSSGAFGNFGGGSDGVQGLSMIDHHLSEEAFGTSVSRK